MLPAIAGRHGLLVEADAISMQERAIDQVIADEHICDARNERRVRARAQGDPFLIGADGAVAAAIHVHDATAPRTHGLPSALEVAPLAHGTPLRLDGIVAE